MESIQEVLVRRNFVSLLTIALAIVLLSCSKSPVGIYKEEGGDRTIEFKPDGTFQASGGIPFLNGVKNGKYTLSDEQLFFEWDRNGRKEGYTTMFGGSFFRLTDNLSEPSPHPYPTLTFIKQTADSSTIASSKPKSDADKLTTDKAQRAVRQWIPNGTVSVLGIQEIPSENSANADLKFDNFQTTYWRGPINFSGPGIATFKHYNDGRWVLTKVHVTFPGGSVADWNDLSIEAK